MNRKPRGSSARRIGKKAKGKKKGASKEGTEQAGPSGQSSNPASEGNEGKKRKRQRKLLAPRKRHSYFKVESKDEEAPDQEPSCSVAPIFEEEVVSGSKLEEEEESFYQNIVSDVIYEGVSLLQASNLEEEDDIHKEFQLDALETINEEDPFQIMIPEDTNYPEVRARFISVVAANLLPHLSSQWVVDIIDGVTLRLFIVSQHENVSVTKAIVWNGTAAKVYVHNKSLPQDNFLFKSKPPHDWKATDEVCDYLYHLASILEHISVCKGVIKHEDAWRRLQDKGEGIIESALYENFSCFRSEKCFLITEETSKCEACRIVQKKMKDQIRRKQEGKDQSHTNYRFLDKAQLTAKASVLQHDKRALEKQIATLRKKIDKEIQKNSINISHDLHEDLSKIFEKHNVNLTKVEKLFWSQQIKALSAREKDRRSMRWNPFIIRLALHIQMRAGTSGYKFLRTFLELPSERLLYDYTHHIDAKEGIQEDTLHSLSKEVLKLAEDHEKYFSVAFDEVHVREGIVINKRTGDVVGYTHLSDVEEELKKLEGDMSGVKFEKKPAKSVLMFLAQGITTGLQGVVGIYPTRNLTSPQLFTRTWNVIYRMESCGLKPLTLLCDGAASNKKFFKMHPQLPPDTIPGLDVNTNEVYGTLNLASHEKRPIFFIVDPPHLLKTLRNCLANSYSHKGSRKMWKDGEDLSWEVLEKLFEETLLDKFRSHKLTKMHIKLTAFSCMKVNLAAQAMSRSVVREICELAESGAAFHGNDTKELCNFILHVNDAFDCFNGSGDISGKRNKTNKLLLPYKDLNDERFTYLVNDMLRFYKDWKVSVMARKGRFSKDSRERMFISSQSYESLQITTFGFIGSVKYMLQRGAPQVEARKFNQDKLEQRFGILRMSGGSNRSLSVAEITQKTISLEVQGRTALPAKHGNTEGNQDLTLDETPLPKRRRKK